MHVAWVAGVELGRGGGVGGKGREKRKRGLRFSLSSPLLFTPVTQATCMSTSCRKFNLFLFSRFFFSYNLGNVFAALNLVQLI